MAAVTKVTEQILLLAHEERALHLVREWFSPRYQMAFSLPEQLLQQPADDCALVVVDGTLLADYSDQLRSFRDSSSRFLPSLALIPVEDKRTMMPHLGQCIDELVTLPLDHEEITTRIENLLLRRKLLGQIAEQTDSLLRISMALESTSDAISITTETGVPVYQNQAFLDLYGFEITEWVGDVESTLLTSSPQGSRIVASLRHGESWQGEVNLHRRDGQTIPTLLRANPIRDRHGHVTGFIYVYTDISNQRRAEIAEHEQIVFTEALRDTTAALVTTLDLDEVLDRILTNIGRVVPSSASSLMLVNDGVATIVRSQGYLDLGVEQDELYALHLRIDKVNGLRWMAETGWPLTVSDDQARVRWFGTAEIPWLRSYIGVPICSGETVLGFLNLSSLEPGAFDPAHGARLQVLAGQAAIAIENARLHEQAMAFTAIRERQRLAHDLHDNVSQTLFSASVISEALIQLWDREPEKMPARLTQLHRLTRGALVQMRALLVEFRPEELLEARFSDLIRYLVDAMRGRAQLQVALDVNGDSRVPDKVKIALYYSILEWFNNIVNYARARRVDVVLDNFPHEVTLTIRDDGLVFDPNGNGVRTEGLKTITERITPIGASFNVVSRDGIGSEVTIHWSADERNAIDGRDESHTGADS